MWNKIMIFLGFRVEDPCKDCIYHKELINGIYFCEHGHYDRRNGKMCSNRSTLNFWDKLVYFLSKG